MALVLFPEFYVVSILGVTMIVLILNKIFIPEGNSIVNSLIAPFIALMLFSTATAIYWFIRELSLFVALLIIPTATREVEDRYNKYFNSLTPTEVI